MMNKQNSVNYRDLKNELDQVLRQLQSEDTDLDEAVLLHEKGKKILEQLEKYLNNVSKNINKK